MTLYEIMTEAVRTEVIRREPLGEFECVEVHIRGGGPPFGGRPAEVVITKSRTDIPKLISERVLGIDDTL